jgi:N-acetylmuramoyl-L-alanine amidase
MNLIADAMEPYLRSSGIRFTRNTPDMTAATSIAQSNQGSYDLHLALHSNAAPEDEAGLRQGSEVYYYPTSVWGQRAAEIIAKTSGHLSLSVAGQNRSHHLSGEVARTRAQPS